MGSLKNNIGAYFVPFLDYVLGAANAPDGFPFAFSYSSLAQLAKSPRHFFQYVVERKFNPQPDKDSDAILLGRVLHNLILECYARGESFENSPYRPMGSYDRRTKAGKEAYENALQELRENGYTPVPSDVWENAQALVYALTGVYKYEGKTHYINQRATRLLDGAIKTEHAFSYFCEESRLPIRGIIDLYGRDNNGDLYVLDLKSARAVDGKSLYYTIKDYAYDLQYYIYSEALFAQLGERPKRGYLLCAGEGEHTNIVEFGFNDYTAGREKFKRAINAYNHCAFYPTDFLRSYDFFSE